VSFAKKLEQLEELRESYYNDNFVKVDGKMLPVDDLFAAIHAFEQKRAMRITRENNYQ